MLKLFVLVTVGDVMKIAALAGTGNFPGDPVVDVNREGAR
jgi:hypothetical protein